MPQRIQRRRTKGYRLPAGAVYVGRPTRWGSPYKVPPDATAADYRIVVTLFRGYLKSHTALVAEIQGELRGRDLACWCPLTNPDGTIVPCHADVLLEFANRDEAS